MADLLVARHGESPSREIYWGTSTAPLAEKGFETAHILAEKLKTAAITKIAHSPQLRAEQTAHVIGNGLAAGINIFADDRLAAKDYGVFNGQPKATVSQSRTGYSTEREILLWAPEGGENYWSVFWRVLSFVADQDRTQDNCLVITHEGVVKVFMCLLHKSTSYLKSDFDYGALTYVSSIVEDIPDRLSWLNNLQTVLALPPAALTRR
jgi:broad specificity phosphatase PhoE